jgi:hypothetical protein
MERMVGIVYYGLLREECWSITSACVPFANLNIQTHELSSLLLPHDSSCYSNQRYEHDCVVNLTLDIVATKIWCKQQRSRKKTVVIEYHSCKYIKTTVRRRAGIKFVWRWTCSSIAKRPPKSKRHRKRAVCDQHDK